MNTAHLHLLLNHLPTIGFGIAMALFTIALLAKEQSLQRAGLVMLFIIAAASIATYSTGNDARQALRQTSNLSDDLMQAHESAALVAFTAMEITGFFAWIALWAWDRRPRFASRDLWVVFVLGAITFLLMARAAYFGGAIRHPETEAAESIVVTPEIPTLARSAGLFVLDRVWVWPASETLHFVGLCMLFGVVLTVNLRMLGMGKNLLSYAALHQLLPLGMLGFGLNLITGMAFLVASPEQYTGGLFTLKMALIGAGAVNLVYFMMLKQPNSIEEGDSAGIWTKLIAASGILIWAVVIFCGHMLPWLGNSF